MKNIKFRRLGITQKKAYNKFAHIRADKRDLNLLAKVCFKNFMVNIKGEKSW